MRAREFITESTNIASAEQVWDYIGGIHPADQQGGGFLKSLVMLNPQYELKRVPLTSLRIPNDEDDGNDPYGRAMYVDVDHAKEYSQHQIDKKPLVVDSQGHILDGAHRAWAASELLNKKDIMAWVPVKTRPSTPQDLELRKKFTKPGVTEGFSNDMSTEDMIAYLRQHHDTNLHQDYLDHINTFSKFVLQNIPVNSIKTDLPALDRAKVEQYKQMDFSKAPPIVIGGGYILDGYHRANVAKALGIPTIKAYVGVQGQQGVTENMDHSQDGRAVAELKSALLAKRDQLQSATDDQVYDIIDQIMTRIARSHSISGQKLHDMWVDKYRQIPDTWIMNENTEQKPVVIYTNNKGATIDDGIKNSLRTTQEPFNKLQMWEKHKSMQDPKIADWVTNKLLPELKQNGVLKPLLVWNNNGQLFVIDGNHRFLAYQEAGCQGRVPVQIVPDNMITISDTVPGQQSVAESVNNYLWHGSKSKHDILYPQQANDTGGKKESNKNAVYATPSAKVAIAMGLTTPGSDTGMFPNDPQMVLFKGGIRKGQMIYLHKVPKDLFIKHNDREWYSKPGVKEVKPIEVVTVPVDKWLHLIRQATPQDLELQKKYMKEGVTESRIIDPEQVDVYYRPVSGSRGRRVVARNIPASTLEPLLQKLSEKYAVPVESFEWTPSEPITEAFDQPYTIQWTKQNGDWHATADLDDGSELIVLFMSQGNNQWMVEFERDENMEITGEGDAPRVFATVLTAMRQFIAKRKPAMLNFSAEKEDDPTGSRARLYDRMIQRYIGGTGYDLTREDMPGGATYTLTKQVQGVAENFADGKGPGRPGDSVRHGIPKHATMAELEKASHAKGRKGQLARWQLNMRRGHKK